MLSKFLRPYVWYVISEILYLRVIIYPFILYCLQKIVNYYFLEDLVSLVRRRSKGESLVVSRLFHVFRVDHQSLVDHFQMVQFPLINFIKGQFETLSCLPEQYRRLSKLRRGFEAACRCSLLPVCWACTFRSRRVSWL